MERNRADTKRDCWTFVKHSLKGPNFVWRAVRKQVLGTMGAPTRFTAKAMQRNDGSRDYCYLGGSKSISVTDAESVLMGSSRDRIRFGARLAQHDVEGPQGRT